MNQNSHNTNVVTGQRINDDKTARDLIVTGHYGHLYSADIHVSTMVPRNTMEVMNNILGKTDKTYKTISEYMKQWMRK